MSCNCKCNEDNSCKQEEQYEEFVPDKEYPVGSFFKIGSEVFKVVTYNENYLRCESCDLSSEEYTYHCDVSRCSSYERNIVVEFILYDTLED